MHTQYLVASEDILYHLHVVCKDHFAWSGLGRDILSIVACAEENSPILSIIAFRNITFRIDSFGSHFSSIASGRAVERGIILTLASSAY